jgi:hypothetical protein
MIHPMMKVNPTTTEVTPNTVGQNTVEADRQALLKVYLQRILVVVGAMSLITQET